MPITVLDSTFKAWIDKMPGSSPKLIVIGKVEAPTLGWKISLGKANPGINPTIIILDITAIPPRGTVPQVITQHDLRFEETPPQEEYEQATIRYDGKEFTIRVKIVS